MVRRYWRIHAIHLIPQHIRKINSIPSLWKFLLQILVKRRIRYYKIRILRIWGKRAAINRDWRKIINFIRQHPRNVYFAECQTKLLIVFRKFPPVPQLNRVTYSMRDYYYSQNFQKDKVLIHEKGPIVQKHNQNDRIEMQCDIQSALCRSDYTLAKFVQQGLVYSKHKYSPWILWVIV